MGCIQAHHCCWRPTVASPNEGTRRWPARSSCRKGSPHSWPSSTRLTRWCEYCRADCRKCRASWLGTRPPQHRPQRHYDQAHGARRLTSRPWYADALASEVIDTMVFARESLCMIISNSDEFQRWLKSNLNRPDCKAASWISNSATSAGIRKHRWDSTYTPLVRAVLTHRALIRTALQIASARKGDSPGDCTEYFLIFVSGPQGVRRLLMLSMLADAADESMLVLRAHDKKMADPADTAFWIAAYVRRVQTLFLDGECLKLGYTRVMMDALKKPLVYIVRGTPLQCGCESGTTPSDVQFCFGKMQCWA